MDRPITNSEPLPQGCARIRPLLDAYHDDALPATRQAAVAGHLKQCGTCATELAGLAALRDVLRRPVEAELAAAPAAGMWERVSEALATPVEADPGEVASTWVQVRERWRRIARPVLIGGSAAALLAVALVVQPQVPQTLNVAKDSFVIEHIDAGDGGVLVYEAESTGMTIIWVIDTDGASARPERQVAS